VSTVGRNTLLRAGRSRPIGVDRASIGCDGIPLKIAAKVDRADQDYYDQLISPLITGIRWSNLSRDRDHEKSDFLSGAMACSCRSTGRSHSLVMIEALACGTPWSPIIEARFRKSSTMA